MMKYLISILVFLSATAFAGTLQCTGTVEKLGLHSNDRILLKLSSMNNAVFICNPNANWSVPGTGYQTSPETCMAMLSMLMHAKATESEMGQVWFDGDNVPSSCNSWQSWQSVNVRYFLY